MADSSRTPGVDPALVESQRGEGRPSDDATRIGTADGRRPLDDPDALGLGEATANDPRVAPPEEEEAARLGDVA